jgi:hypothetical protein
MIRHSATSFTKIQRGPLDQGDRRLGSFLYPLVFRVFCAPSGRRFDHGRDKSEPRVKCPGLLLAGFLRRPVSLQLGRQLGSSCRTHSLFLGSRFSRTRRFRSSQVRPSYFLSSCDFFLVEVLMVWFFFGAVRDLARAPKMPRNSLFKRSICSLIAAARMSWSGFRSYIFMRQVNIRSRWRNQAVVRCSLL